MLKKNWHNNYNIYKFTDILSFIFEKFDVVQQVLVEKAVLYFSALGYIS